MPWVGFEPTIPVFEQAKKINALDCAAAVIGTDETKMEHLWNYNC
jgi:hypothetical protein